MPNLEQKNWQWIEVYPILNLCMLCTSQQQFWSEIILLISNRTRAKSRVWFQTKLHSTQSNYNYLSLTLEWGLFKSLKKNAKNRHNEQIKLSKVQTCMTDLASYSLRQWQFWQLTSKWLSGACKQYYCCFLRLIFIQLCDSKQTHYLTHEFRVKLHLKTDIARISSQYARYRFSYAI